MQQTYNNRRWNPTDVDTLAACLRKLPPIGQPQGLKYMPPALKLLDCVLSLNRNYGKFVVPTVGGFNSNHPDVKTLGELDYFVSACGGAADFFAHELKYNDAERAETFAGVLAYAMNVVRSSTGTSELDALRHWAVSVAPKDYKQPPPGKSRIHGFGLAGWQYLRMLFGADTCKPDTHINGFVIDCLNRQVSRLSVLDLMEAAAPRAGLSVREADLRIWNQRSSGNSGCVTRLSQP